MFNLSQINRETKFFGVLGYPLSHTLSPLIHNTLFSEYKQNSIYLVFEKEHPDKYTLFKEKGLIKIHGLSVTIPHKEWAFQISDECDEVGRMMEASNTLILNTEEGFIHSYNTDGMGAVRAILETKKNFLNNPKDILLLGSGGSARGISFALLKSGFPNKIVISARNEVKAKQIVGILNGIRPYSSEYSPIPTNLNDNKRYSLIINTTPLGMKDNPSELLLPEDYINKNHIVFDIVYNPTKTPLVENALKNGAKIIPGYEMLLYQAMEQFRLFSGITPSSRHVNQIRKLLQSKLES